MKIKRVKTDATGNVVTDPTTGQPVIEEVEMFSQDEVNAQSREAANTARTRLQSDLEAERNARTQLEGQLAERERRERERERAALPPDQQVMARLGDMESQLAQERAQRAQEAAANQQAIRRVGLVAYRERVLREVPEEVHHLVFGDSEEAIDASADLARNTFEELQKKLEARLLAGQGVTGAVNLQQQNPHQPHAQHYGAPAPYYQGQPVPYVQPALPPANPAYVPPVPQYVQAQGGFPTATNPLPVPEPTGDGQIDLTSMTTEAAVRSGRYGGEMRERVLGAMKGQMKYPGSLGSTPRHWNAPAPPANHTAQPMGVMQPQGFPTGPTQPAHLNPQTYQPVQPPPPPATPYAQPPQMVMPAPMPVPQAPLQQYAPQAYPPVAAPQYAPAPVPHQPAQNGHRAAAAEAVARMHAGQIGAVDGAEEARSALQQSAQFASARGIANPQQAFAARFTPTPPIQPGTN